MWWVGPTWATFKHRNHPRIPRNHPRVPIRQISFRVKFHHIQTSSHFPAIMKLRSWFVGLGDNIYLDYFPFLGCFYYQTPILAEALLLGTNTPNYPIHYLPIDSNCLLTSDKTTFSKDKPDREVSVRNVSNQQLLLIVAIVNCANCCCCCCYQATTISKKLKRDCALQSWRFYLQAQ